MEEVKAIKPPSLMQSHYGTQNFCYAKLSPIQGLLMLTIALRARFEGDSTTSLEKPAV